MGDIKFSIDTGLIEALKRELPLEVLVETGTFEGDAIEIARPYFQIVHSIELSPEYFELAKSRFSQDSAVHLYLGDSGKMLASLRPKFAEKSALFWLDAHWCVAQDTGGEKSQCPLLDEIRAIGPLGNDSAIMIDDARLFASPPPQPHEISQWPRLDEVIDALRSVGQSHELKIFNDVIVFAPRAAHAALTAYMTRHTVTLLKIKDKADGYDILDAQLKEKQIEIAALKKAAVEKDTEIVDLKNETDVKDGEIASLKNETNFKDTEISSLKHEADVKDGEIGSLKNETNFKDTEIASLKHEADVKDGEIGSLKNETNGKDVEIASLKQISNEREQLIFTLDGHIKNFQKIVAHQNAAQEARQEELSRLTAAVAALETQLAEKTAALMQTKAALAATSETVKSRDPEIAPKLVRLEKLEKILASMPPNAEEISGWLADKDVHIRNIEALLITRDRELVAQRSQLAERETSLYQLLNGYAHLEVAKFYGRQLAEKEAVLQSLKRVCDEREAVIKQLAIDATTFGAQMRKMSVGLGTWWQAKVSRPFGKWLFDRVVEKYWMQIGILRQYPARAIVWDRFPKPKLAVHRLPQVGIVTPSFNQKQYIESTMLSVLNQNYAKLRYVVQDGASTDGSQAIIGRHKAKLVHFESAPDRGQADAIGRGFKHLTDLGDDDIMAWLNSDDFINPRALRYVAEYFATHPDVDVVYGHRLIIDEHDQEIGRWVMPPHDRATLEWIDYVPQETLFWRKRAWDLAGGIDPDFQFALDWDLLLRFQAINAKIVRLPYFLGSFRVHANQKTSRHIHSIGSEEMTKIRTRIHPRGIDPEKIQQYADKARFDGAICSRLRAIKIRY